MEALEQLAGDRALPHHAPADADVHALSRQLRDAQSQLELLRRDMDSQAQLIVELTEEKERLSRVPLTLTADVTSVVNERAVFVRPAPTTDQSVLGAYVLLCACRLLVGVGCSRERGRWERSRDRTAELAAEAALLASQLQDKEKRILSMNSELSDIIAALGLPPLSGDTDGTRSRTSALLSLYAHRGVAIGDSSGGRVDCGAQAHCGAGGRTGRSAGDTRRRAHRAGVQHCGRRGRR